MTLRKTCIVMIAAAACSLQAADDETQFKAKPYAPRKSSGDTAAYRASAYTPARPATASAPAYESSAPKSRWSFFKRKPAEEAKPLASEKLADATPYTQQKHISVPTIKADPGAIQEKRPYIASESAKAAEVFTPAEKSEWKNPLLKPRQGIKESAQ